MDIKRTTIRLPNELHVMISQLAKKYGISFNSMIIELLRDGYLVYVKGIGLEMSK